MRVDKKNIIWDSGIRQSDQSILIRYDGPVLNPGTKYYWKVKVWDNNGNESEWSKPGEFTTGLFKSEDWSGAEWVAYDELDPARRIVPGIHMPSRNEKWKNIVPLFRCNF